jgi:hypothetical protein
MILARKRLAAFLLHKNGKGDLQSGKQIGETHA